jgi:hypothetical protein
LVNVSARLDRATTITVSERTRRLLESVKADGDTFDQTIQDLPEETHFDDEVSGEIERRWPSEPRIAGHDVTRRAGLS